MGVSVRTLMLMICCCCVDVAVVALVEDSPEDCMLPEDVSIRLYSPRGFVHMTYPEDSAQMILSR